MRADDWLRFCQAQRRDVTTGERLSGEAASIPAKDTRQAAKLEPAPSRESLGEAKDKAPCPERLHLKFVSVRKRLTDPDNLCTKWTTDMLRYCGALRDDTTEDITIETSQRKCQKGEEEHTILEVWR